LQRWTDNRIVVIGVYFDDSDLDAVKKDLRARYNMKDLGSLSSVFVMEIHRDKSGIYVSQAKHIREMMEAIPGQYLQERVTPMRMDFDHQAESRPFANSSLFRSILGMR
jgi:hypothetical protein